MTYFPVANPYNIFTDTDGLPLENGYIYVGEANLNPVTNPITVYWDEAGLYPAAQPIRTINGYPSRAGSAAKIYTNAGAYEDYSLLIKDRHLRTVHYVRSTLFGTGAFSNSVDIIADLRDINGYGQPLYVRGHSSIGDGGQGIFEWFDGAAPGTYVDDNGITIVPTGGDGSGAWIRSHDGVINIRDFGIIGDGVTDDSIKLNIISGLAKGDDATGENRSIYKIIVPAPLVTYRLENPWVIDGTHGLIIDCVGWFVERQTTTDNKAQFTWAGVSSLPVLHIKGGAGVPSNPNFDVNINNISISGLETAVKAPNAPGGTEALAGIYIGALDGDTQAVVNRTIKISSAYIINCRFGIYSGSPGGGNTDNALTIISDSQMNNNFQAGIHWGTGNALLSLISNYIVNNGWYGSSYAADNYMTNRGANIYLASGTLDIVDLATAGAGDNQPSSADIYQQSGRISINNMWSDTHGYVFYQAGASAIGSAYQVALISGIRHYAGDMTAVNTPNSMRITVPGQNVIGCFIYGNIEVVSGIAGKPVFSGINFIRAGATFTGSGIETQRSLIEIGAGPGNSAQIKFGGRNSGLSLSYVGALVPQLLSMGTSQTSGYSILQALGAAATDSGATLTMGASNGSLELYSNCYVNNTAAFTFLAHKVGAGFRFIFGGSGGVNNPLKIFVYEFTDLVTPIASSSFIEVGGFISGGAAGSYSQVVFKFPHRTADPTYSSGDWWEGGVYYNTATNKLRCNTGAGTWVDIF